MKQLGMASARGAALAGNGWKSSEAFSVAGLLQRSPQKKREALLRAAIRRMQYAKDGDAARR